MARRNPRPFRDKTIIAWQKEGTAITPAWAFDPQNVDNWREGLRTALRERLGPWPERACALRPETVDTFEDADCLIEKVVFDPEANLSMPAYLLRPKETKGPLPAVVCLADHGPGKAESVGFVDRGLGADFALQLARAGYIAIAPEARACGEREENEEQAVLAGLLLDRPLMGARAWDVLRTVDYLLTRPEVDTGKIGCMGLGLGGWLTLLAAGLDERIQCAVVSGFFGTWQACLMEQRQCLCYYVPGLMRIADLSDVASLTAPRPLFLEQGRHDPTCPIQIARQAYLKLRYTYDTLGAGEHLEMEVFEGGHRFWGQRSYGWIGRWLRKW
jgi:fermentation-respiration switch protein FrsA (DUF1100 family)